jgi:hypothetical protein
MAAIFAVSFAPRAPVQAFAQPELQKNALILFEGSMDSHQSTLEARMAFVVKVPAAAAGVSLTTMARSLLPDALIPAFTPAAQKPAAAVTPPLIVSMFDFLIRTVCSFFVYG